ncbi:hypothetical protein [Salmonella enterica]|uniref:hypothetical protein n=1 Tax=Salmonella enterica TaxID=28901 RepID=UPI0039C5EB68
MSNKNEVFEYLIGQLRQQVNKKDVTSFNVSVRISDLDEVKQVIHNLQQHIAGKDDEIRVLKDSLRQQVNNGPYKQQCEDLAHEVQSLKNQLRDMSAQIKELHMALVKATGDAEAYKLIRKGGHRPEQSGCRKEDTQECAHDWVLDEKGDYFVCAKCGKQEAELIDCQHTNTVGLRKGFAPGFTKKCLDCGAKLR